MIPQHLTQARLRSNDLSLAWAIVFFCLQFVSLNLSANELDQSHSPYLKMHANDPVNWHLIDKRLLQQAQKENKLIYISSGYYSCHWCHVMQKESYQNKAIADFLNKHFIAVKIDRELNPALDHYLIEFVTATRGNAGWPMNVFITPQGYPLIGLSYLPPKKFLRLLQDLQKQWQDEQKNLEELAFNANAELNQQNLRPAQPKDKLIKRYLATAERLIDDFNGGFGEQSKFPMSPNLLLLLKLVQQQGSERLRHFIPLTLDKMVNSGLHDPVNGGFFRYTINAEWETPHFEKMLYDNAQLAKIYLLADKHYPNHGYQQVAFKTLDFILKQMASADGGFISSWTADDNHKTEGGYYLWSKTQLRQLLTDKQYQLIQKFWQWNTLEESGENLFYPIQTISLKNYSKKNKLPYRTLATQIAQIKQILADFQQKNRQNPKDTKRVSSWNALLLESLSLAAQQNPRFTEPAKKLQNWMQTKLFKQQQLYRDGFLSKKATLEDYAYFIKALLQYQKIQKDMNPLIKKLIKQTWQKFYQDGQWHDSEDTYLPGQGGYYMQQDRAIPSGAAVFIQANRLWLEKHPNSPWKKHLEQASQNQTEDFQQDPFWYSSWLY